MLNIWVKICEKQLSRFFFFSVWNLDFHQVTISYVDNKGFGTLNFYCFLVFNEIWLQNKEDGKTQALPKLQMLFFFF